jgi:hypothetical protein
MFIAPVLFCQTQPLPEYDVKAAFLLNFTRFVEWPQSSFAASNSPLNICVLAPDPFGSTLDQIVEGETAGTRKITIERIRRVPATGCHVIFVTGLDRTALKNVAPGTLTVGEGEDFLKEGGMIAFILDNRRVRFDINQSAAASAGLKISSQLLRIARSVKK